MSTILENIQAKVRYDVDKLKSHYKAYLYENSNEFDLPESNTQSITSITVGGSTISASKYSYNSTTNKVTIDADQLSSSSSVIIYYTYYDYSDDELNGYIIRALGQLSINKYTKNGEYLRVNDLTTPTKILPRPNEGEENLIAFIVGIFIRPSYSRYSIPLLTIQYVKKMDTDEKIAMVIDKFNVNLGYSGFISL